MVAAEKECEINITRRDVEIPEEILQLALVRECHGFRVEYTSG